MQVLKLFYTYTVDSRNMSKVATEHINRNPDDIIHEMGGCGRFQIRMAVIVHFIKIIVCWSTMCMVFVTATPKWICVHGDLNSTVRNEENSSETKTCSVINGTKCSTFEFSTEMRTVVSEVGI